MSKLFCNNEELCLLERQMRQPPGYRPRGHDICMAQKSTWMTRNDYRKLVDYVICHMHMEQLEIRIKELFGRNNQSLFRNLEHEKRYDCILQNLLVNGWEMDFVFEAAVYLLTADNELWEKAKRGVQGAAIQFDRIKLGEVILEQYILFHAAKDIYCRTRHIQISELADRELISDEILWLIINGFVIERYGIRSFR